MESVKSVRCEYLWGDYLAFRVCGLCVSVVRVCGLCVYIPVCVGVYIPVCGNPLAVS